jgi:hypothetical protein
LPCAWTPSAVAALNLDETRLEGLVADVRNAFERVDQFMNMV